MYRRLKEEAFRLLRWSERYTKTDMVYLAKGGSWLGFGQAVSSSFAFLLSIAFANLLPKESYGEYRYVLSIVGIASAFSLTGMGTALSQAVARGMDGTLPKSFRAALVWSLGATVILLSGALYYFAQGNTTLGWSLLIAAIATPLLKSFNLYGAFIIGKKDFGRKVRYGIVYDVIPILAILSTLTQTNNPIVIVGVYFSSYVATAVILYFFMWRRYAPHGPADGSVTAYSLHLSAMDLVGNVSFQLDKVLAFHYLGAAELAVYSFALAVPQQIRQIQKHVGTLVFPKFSQQSFVAIRQNIIGKSLRMLLVMGVLTATYILVAPFIYRVFFPQYLESVLYSQIFSLTLLMGPVTLFKQGLVAHKKTRELYIVNTTVPLLKIAILFPLTISFGIMGTIIALLSTELLGGVLSILLFFKADEQEESAAS